MIKQRLWTSLAALAVAAPLYLLPISAQAAPWSGVHQGRLFDQLGNPVTGELTVVFTIYDDAVAGAALWSESFDISFDEGYKIRHRVDELTAIAEGVPGHDGG